MSLGTPFSHCPRCWEDSKTCQCSRKELDAYYKKIEKEKEKEKENSFSKEERKHPIWEAWERYKRNQK